MKFEPYLMFLNQCKEAFTFYAKLFGGEIEFMQTFGESPAAGDMPPETHDNIMHVRLRVGGQAIMGSDCPPDYYAKPQGTTISIQLTDIKQGKRLFDALAEGGTVNMPFEKTFWAEGFGMVVDRFGTPWMVNCGEPVQQR